MIVVVLVALAVAVGLYLLLAAIILVATRPRRPRPVPPPPPLVVIDGPTVAEVHLQPYAYQTREQVEAAHRRRYQRYVRRMGY